MLIEISLQEIIFVANVLISCVLPANSNLNKVFKLNFSKIKSQALQ
jgi:hypothetical protein